MKIGEVFRTDDFKNEKHVPVIEIPDDIKSNELFEITVSVGKEIAHPNVSEHFIAWMKLYYKVDGDPNVYEIGKAEFSAHGASVKGANSLELHSEPTAKFHMKSEKPGTLIATSYCNIHGLWENSVRIEF